MRRRTTPRILAPALVAALGAFIVPGLAASERVVVGPQISVYEASPEQVRLVRWAVSRFEGAGLEVPRVEIHFHGDGSGCDGDVGHAINSRVDICDTLVNAMTRYLVLHELGHIWLDQNLETSTRERFLQLRGLRAWNSLSDPWELRGYEQGAEILAWGLGDRILTPTIPDDDPEPIAAGYELLTGTSIPVRLRLEGGGSDSGDARFDGPCPGEPGPSHLRASGDPHA